MYDKEWKGGKEREGRVYGMKRDEMAVLIELLSKTRKYPLLTVDQKHNPTSKNFYFFMLQKKNDTETGDT